MFKKLSVLLSFILLFKIATAQELFDKSWKFSLQDNPLNSTENFNDKTWRSLDLPHDWSVEGTTNIDHTMGNDGGYFPAGVGWYRKTFSVPTTWKGQQLSIYFEGVYMNAEVFINGKSLGVYPYGYTSYLYDLTPHLKYGGNNVVAVRVDNSKQKNSRWYTGSGIYRHVWLLKNNPVHVEHWGVFITTPQVSKEKATVQGWGCEIERECSRVAGGGCDDWGWFPFLVKKLQSAQKLHAVRL